MTAERKELLAKVNSLINRRKKQLLEKLPDVHEVNDGIIIRFFTEWDNCDSNEDIKYRRIINIDKPEEITIFYYIPKGVYIELKERNFIHCMTCLNGKLEIIMGDTIRILETQTKICLNTNMFEGRALENSYIVTTNKG